MIKKTITLLFLYLITFTFIKVVWVDYFINWTKHEAFKQLIISFVIGFFLFKKYSRKLSFYQVLRHELSHWFFAFIFLNRPSSLKINEDGSGEYTFRGKENYLVVLAPYFFPLVSFFVLLLQFLMEKPSDLYYILLGVVISFDLSSMYNDYHLNQTDWKKYGIIFSIQFSILLSIIFLISILIILFGGFLGYFDFVKNIYFFIENFY